MTEGMWVKKIFIKQYRFTGLSPLQEHAGEQQLWIRQKSSWFSPEAHTLDPHTAPLLEHILMRTSGTWPKLCVLVSTRDLMTGFIHQVVIPTTCLFSSEILWISPVGTSVLCYSKNSLSLRHPRWMPVFGASRAGDFCLAPRKKRKKKSCFQRPWFHSREEEKASC